MNIFKREKNGTKKKICLQTSRNTKLDVGIGFPPEVQFPLFSNIRASIPIIDAAISKIIRLIGDFKIKSDNEFMTEQVEYFLRDVKVVGNSNGIHNFVTCYLDSMLTFGSALGEIIPDVNGDSIAALINVDMKRIVLKRKSASLETEFWISRGLNYEKIAHPELLLFSALNPTAGEPYGNSLIKGLPFVSGILLKIYNSIGLNFDRVGNIRFSVNYKPVPNSMDADCAQEIAQNIATQWEQAMSDGAAGIVRDFISVGDVDIKVIGADNNVIDTEIPVRQMLEQIVAKMGVPPFLLGLSWATTERMSKQQSDILISEIESYRRIVTPGINKIIKLWARLSGFDDKFMIVWDKINLHDELTQARAKLLMEQARHIEAQTSN
ncbi:MAG: serine/threonine protein phosphatase [Oscillospiraceae bacterium]|nr:serine/threonine protein phosphatase [Oscillospiraceae bacterium]